MGVELDQDTAQLIAEELKAGRCHSAQEFISRAVKHFVISRELGEEYTLDEIDDKISRGIASLERGEGVDGEQFLDSLEAELNAEEESRKAG
jgi:antitoxin ParD1/3/4